MIKHHLSVGQLSVSLGLATLLLITGCGQRDEAPATKGGPPMVRRLTEVEYRRIVADVFGGSIKVPGHFDPDIRRAGLIAIGTSQESVATAGMEQYDLTARSIAAQVVDEAHRDTLVSCKPAKATEPDDACATTFFSRIGRLLFRRPLTADELRAYVGSASKGAKELGSFYAGLGEGLAAVLVSPQFLFRTEVAYANSAHPGQDRLDAYSKAERLSFFLWDTAPDERLLNAAKAGELETDEGLQKQVDRMIASPRLAAGLRAFFSDMLGFDGFVALAKDPTIYPRYSGQVSIDAQEQTLRTLTDLLITQKSDYRDIFTTRKTFLNQLLGSVYNVPSTAEDGWVAHVYPENDPHIGILSQVSFLSLHSHPGRSSPTLRGKALREIFLCQKVPDPPGNVNFALVNDTKNPAFHTARARLTAHRTEATCAGCHKIMDPIGLALENFDSASGYRTLENGDQIVTAGEIDGKKFEDVFGFTKAIHDHPMVPSCLVNRLYSFGVGRIPSKDEASWINYQVKQFEAGGFKVLPLMRRIATSSAFYRVSTPSNETTAAIAPRAAPSETLPEAGK